MATSAGRAKRDREKAKQEKQVLKREKKQALQESKAEGEGDAPVIAAPQDEVLARLAALHDAFRDGTVDFDDFEAQREELLRALEV